jgi:hypothetical protein
MGFLQIISFATDRYDEFEALEHQWVEDTAGRRTSVGGQLFADRDRPGHYVALDWFDSYDSAMTNSALPETDAFAQKAMALATEGPTFWNLEPALPEWNAQEDNLKVALQTSTVPEGTFTDDVVLDMLVPHGRYRSTGVAELGQGLTTEAPGRDLELWRAHATADGFAVEYAYRTHGTPSLAAGLILVTMRDGRIARLLVTCAGNWSPETEAEVVAQTGPLG